MKKGLSCYVGSKYENKQVVREYMDLLKQAGNTISHDWTTAEQASRKAAMLDLRGVADCDVFVGVFDQEVDYNGTLVELGAALALGKPVYILGNWSGIKKGIFFKHPAVRFGDNAFTRDLLT